LRRHNSRGDGDDGGVDAWSLRRQQCGHVAVEGDGSEAMVREVDEGWHRRGEVRSRSVRRRCSGE
jgi:hypothetical protein